jgi:hypothetical protein
MPIPRKQEQLDLSDVFGKDLDHERLQRPPEPMPPSRPQAPTGPPDPGKLLLVIIFVIWGRLAHYAFVEDWGSKGADGGRLLNGVAILLVIVLFFVWMRMEWSRSRWLMLPSALLVLVATKICLTAMNFGADGYKDFLPSHPVWIAMGASAALMVAASPLFKFLMHHVMEFLTDPINKMRGT